MMNDFCDKAKCVYPGDSIKAEIAYFQAEKSRRTYIYAYAPESIFVSGLLPIESEF